MTRIAVSGYYGFKNTGDEIVLYSMIRSLEKIDPGLEIVVLSNSPGATAESYGVDAVNRWRPRQVWKALRQCRLLISGGGSLLQDITGPKSIFYYLGVAKLARLLRKPVMFYAQGIGPLNNSLSRKLVKRVANEVQYITVRDEGSAQLLRELGVTNHRLEVTADPVFALEPDLLDLPDGGKILKEAGADPHKPIIAFAMRQWQQFEEYKKAAAKVADTLMERGYRVVFWPLHFPEDVALSREIARKMKHEPVILKQQYSVPQMLSVAGEFQLVVGMRLHSLIMAAVQGIPFVGLSYDPKVETLVKIMEQIQAGKVETIKSDKLLRSVDEALEKRDVLQEKIRMNTSQLRELAEQTAQKAFELMLKEGR